MYIFEQLKKGIFLLKRQVFPISFDLASVFKGFIFEQSAEN